MCFSMFVRGLAWHAILRAAPTWRKARRRDALQGTFIGVLMSATLPARLGEPSRALIVARRIGRARETLPIVLGTMVSQTLLNLLALALLGIAMLCGAPLLHGQGGALLVPALVPLGVADVRAASAGASCRGGGDRVENRSPRGPSASAGRRLRRALLLVREGLRIFRRPRQAALATAAQLAAWALQCVSCWLLLDGARAGRARWIGRCGGGPVRGQRDRRGARDTGERRRVPGGLRGGVDAAPTTSRRPTRSPTGSSCRPSRSRPHADGNAGAA